MATTYSDFYGRLKKVALHAERVSAMEGKALLAQFFHDEIKDWPHQVRQYLGDRTKLREMVNLGQRAGGWYKNMVVAIAQESTQRLNPLALRPKTSLRDPIPGSEKKLGELGLTARDAKGVLVDAHGFGAWLKEQVKKGNPQVGVVLLDRNKIREAERYLKEAFPNEGGKYATVLRAYAMQDRRDILGTMTKVAGVSKAPGGNTGSGLETPLAASLDKTRQYLNKLISKEVEKANVSFQQYAAAPKAQQSAADYLDHLMFKMERSIGKTTAVTENLFDPVKSSGLIKAMKKQFGERKAAAYVTALQTARSWLMKQRGGQKEVHLRNMDFILPQRTESMRRRDPNTGSQSGDLHHTGQRVVRIPAHVTRSADSIYQYVRRRYRSDAAMRELVNLAAVSRAIPSFAQQEGKIRGTYVPKRRVHVGQGVPTDMKQIMMKVYYDEFKRTSNRQPAENVGGEGARVPMQNSVHRGKTLRTLALRVPSYFVGLANLRDVPLEAQDMNAVDHRWERIKGRRMTYGERFKDFYKEYDRFSKHPWVKAIIDEHAEIGDTKSPRDLQPHWRDGKTPGFKDFVKYMGLRGRLNNWYGIYEEWLKKAPPAEIQEMIRWRDTSRRSGFATSDAWSGTVRDLVVKQIGKEIQEKMSSSQYMKMMGKPMLGGSWVKSVIEEGEARAARKRDHKKVEYTMLYGPRRASLRYPQTPRDEETMMSQGTANFYQDLNKEAKRRIREFNKDLYSMPGIQEHIAMLRSMAIKDATKSWGLDTKSVNQVMKQFEEPFQVGGLSTNVGVSLAFRARAFKEMTLRQVHDAMLSMRMEHKLEGMEKQILGVRMDPVDVNDAEVSGEARVVGRRARVTNMAKEAALITGDYQEDPEEVLQEHGVNFLTRIKQAESREHMMDIAADWKELTGTSRGMAWSPERGGVQEPSMDEQRFPVQVPLVHPVIEAVKKEYMRKWNAMPAIEGQAPGPPI